jgi:hypothetical protein
MSQRLATSPDNSAHDAKTVFDKNTKYLPPYRHLLGVLGVDHLDLKSKSVSVSVEGLVFLLCSVLSNVRVDEAWYLERYVDVKAAILAGDTQSASYHFRTSGYLEGRLPYQLPFDSDYYFKQYADLAATYDSTDSKGLRAHFESKGYYEGRVGVPEQFGDAERWWAALSASA